MKPDNEDLDLALERRLTEVGRAHRPGPPEDLVRFIDTVPTARAGRAWGLSVGRRGNVLRATVLAAAALLIAGLATTAIVNIRTSQNAAAGPGWTWHALTGGPVRYPYAATPGGFLAHCGADPEATKACSSQDGISWTDGVKPAVASIEGVHAAEASLGNVQKVGGVYVAVAAGWAGLLRSTDGIHWQPVQSQILDDALALGSSSMYLTTLANHFAYVVGHPDADGSAVYLSSDGVVWTRSSLLPERPDGGYGAGPAGLYLSGGTPTRYWRTVDGVSWTAVVTPGIPLWARTLPDGSYLAWPFGDVSALRSTDGLTWDATQLGLAAPIEALAVSGGRILAEAGSLGSLDRTSPIWESLDSGATWHELLGPDGQQLHGAPLAVGNAMFILGGTVKDPNVACVGFLDGSK